MEVLLNGERRTYEGPLTIGALLEREGIPADRMGIAVAVNRRVIPRTRWHEVYLQGGEMVELVYARQGG
jgi:sulfur carrier protein